MSVKCEDSWVLYFSPNSSHPFPGTGVRSILCLFLNSRLLLLGMELCPGFRQVLCLCHSDTWSHLMLIQGLEHEWALPDIFAPASDRGRFCTSISVSKGVFLRSPACLQFWVFFFLAFYCDCHFFHGLPNVKLFICFVSPHRTCHTSKFNYFCCLAALDLR